jgi:hypothetical protein
MAINSSIVVVEVNYLSYAYLTFKKYFYFGFLLGLVK